MPGSVAEARAIRAVMKPFGIRGTAGSVITHMQGVVEWGAGGYIYRRRLKEREGKM